MNNKECLKQFFCGVPKNFKDSLELLNEEQLVALHREMIRNKIGGKTSVTLGALALIPSLGLSAIDAGIGLQRINVNTDRIRMMEHRLSEMGWEGHTTNWKDYAIPVTLGAVGLVVGFGVDGLVDSASGGAPGISSAESFNAATSVDGSEGVVQPPPPGPDIIEPATAQPSMPPAAIPQVTWDITPEQGMTMFVNGVPCDPSYGQVGTGGLFQAPVDAAAPGTGSYLSWPGNTFVPGPDSYASNPYEFYNADGSNVSTKAGDADTTVHEPQVTQVAQVTQTTQFDMTQHIYEQYLIVGDSCGAENLVIGAATTVVAGASAHTAHHLLPSMIHASGDAAVKQAAESAAKKSRQGNLGSS